MHYGDEESIDFTNIYFYTVLYNALKASNKLAREDATGAYFVVFSSVELAVAADLTFLILGELCGIDVGCVLNVT
jgi:ribonucleotide reductase alpha subunit